jgi:glycosyltransferase involved in cell wall biosynthesis
LRVIHAFAPGPVGGAEQVVADLTLALRREGVDVHLVLVLDETEHDHLFLELVSSEIVTHPVFVPRRAYRYEFRELGKLFRRLRPQIVHTHVYRANVIAAAAARRLKVPVVSTAHGFTGRSLKIRVFQAMERVSFRRADAVVAVSRALGEELARFKLPASRIHVIANARSYPEAPIPRNEARGRLGVGPENFVVGWVGRLGREKAPDIMLEAIEDLVSVGRIPDLRVAMVGDGPNLESLKKQSRDLGCDGIVSWLGLIPNAARLFRGFDVIVMSSRSEGTPIVALEAMALGVPLVATDVGGIVDLTGREAAAIVPPEDPSALARAVEAVYTDRVAAAHRARLAKERIASHASVERWARRHVDIYERICGAGAVAGVAAPVRPG